MHPLMSDLTQLSDADFQKQLGKLMSMMTQGRRLGFSLDYVNQLSFLYQSYLEEQQRRYQVLMEKTQQQASDAFQDKIDIK
jgi:hypothetical protein